MINVTHSDGAVVLKEQQKGSTLGRHAAIKVDL